MSHPGKRRRLKITAGVLAFGFAAFWVFPTVILAFEGKLKTEEVASARSPDGRFAISITKRAAIPVNELFDPTIVVTVRLLAGDERVLASQSVKLMEDSDLRAPAIHWSTNRVELLNFDQRQPRQLELPLPP